MADIWTTIAAERNRAADEFEHLTPEQLATPSQCDAFDVRQACAHLLLPFEYSTPRFLLGVLANRGNLDAFSRKATHKLAERYSHAEVISKLRQHATNEWTPPGNKFGPEIPLSEIVVHSQDIRNVLGMACTIPAETIDLALDGITDDEVRRDYANRIGSAALAG